MTYSLRTERLTLRAHDEGDVGCELFEITAASPEGDTARGGQP